MDKLKRTPRQRRGPARQDRPPPQARGGPPDQGRSTAAARRAALQADTAETAARRLTEIEIKLCYQEDTIEKLNQMILRQQEQIDWLGRQIGDLEERSLHAAPDDRGLRDDPPPHY
jgi:SlyX protein